MRETVRAYVSEGSKYVWICSIKIQNLHNCSWVVSETANGYEYAWISHEFWICFNIHEYV